METSKSTESLPLPERRARLLAGMQQVMGPLPGDERRAPLELKVHSEEKLPSFTRQLVSFATEPNDRVQAYLLRPTKPKTIDGKTPAMLCLHQTTGFKKEEPAGVAGLPNLHYAAHLAERGYITLAPDYALGMAFEGHGQSEFDPYDHGYQSATMKGIWNHRAALDLLQSLPEVAGDHLGAIGHSLGGHNSIFIASFDERVKVVVSSCGFTRFGKYMHGDLTGWSHTGYMPRIATEYGKDPARMPFDFPEALAVLAPRAFFTNSPLSDSNFDPDGVKDCLAVARPVYEALGVPEKIDAVFPECGHDFPPEAREVAYAFIDRWI